MTSVAPLGLTARLSAATSPAVPPASASFADLIDPPAPPGHAGQSTPRPSPTPGLIAPLPVLVDSASVADAADAQPPEPLVAIQPDGSAEFLDTARPVARQSRLFGFDELGMFGQFGAQFAAAASRPAPGTAEPIAPATIGRAPAEPITYIYASPQAAARGDAAVSVAAGRPLQPRQALPQTDGVPPPETSRDDTAHPGDAAAFADQDEVVTAVLSRVWSSPAIPEASPLLQPAGPDGIEASAGPDAMPPLPPSAKTESPVNLTVAGQPGALSIILRSSGGSAEDDAKLRRRIEDTAAEFGMTVAELQLNGDPPSFASLLGGPRGNRTR